MASPGLESFCCMFANSSVDYFHHNLSVENEGFLTYNILCLVSSSVSIGGAIYQLWPKEIASLPRGRKESEAYLRQTSIICWLALADLFASIGICVRSCLWLTGYIPTDGTTDLADNPDFAHLFCAINSGWIQYFYICTYFWTFSYAFDTYRQSQSKTSHMCVYHIMSWVIPAVVTGAGLVTLYDPSLLSCEHTLGHLIPHYLSSYLPILMVMICNPILYANASQSVRISLMRRGRYTDQERNIISIVNEKFLLVIVVFYVCWLPNIINGILLIFHHTISDSVFLGIWQFMALVNPCQAFLNTLVYRGSGGVRCPSLLERLKASSRTQIQDSITDESMEHSPLLSYRR